MPTPVLDTRRFTPTWPGWYWDSRTGGFVTREEAIARSDMPSAAAVGAADLGWVMSAQPYGPPMPLGLGSADYSNFRTSPPDVWDPDTSGPYTPRDESYQRWLADYNRKLDLAYPAPSAGGGGQAARHPHEIYMDRLRSIFSPAGQGWAEQFGAAHLWPNSGARQLPGERFNQRWTQYLDPRDDRAMLTKLQAAANAYTTPDWNRNVDNDPSEFSKNLQGELLDQAWGRKYMSTPGAVKDANGMIPEHVWQWHYNNPDYDVAAWL